MGEIFAAAVAHHQAGRVTEAVRLYGAVLAIDGAHADTLHLLGIAAHTLGRDDLSIDLIGQAIALAPDNAEARNDLAIALKEQRRLDEAATSLRAALALAPDFLAAHNNLGIVLREQGRLDAAIAAFRRAVALRPDRAEARKNLGMALLARGDFSEGFEHFEFRWRTPAMAEAARKLPAAPRWRGEPAAGRGKTLLIQAEQGFGDTLQFCRYAPMAAARGWRVLLAVQPPLVRLLQNSFPQVRRVVACGDAAPSEEKIDCYCPMLSLPLAFGTTRETIPAGEKAYLRADAKGVARWRRRLAAVAGTKTCVGLAWAGAKNLPVDGRRSLPPALLAPLFKMPGIQFVSLQKDGSDKHGTAAPGEFRIVDFMHEMRDFADTAALVANLDLVISVDTAVAHLAAALGRPVWLLDRHDPCWRWLVGRGDSPWYPTLRLYRQPRPGDWESVVAAAAGDLRGPGIAKSGVPTDVNNDRCRRVA